MIIAELVLEQENTQWRIPWHRNIIQEQVTVEHTVPMSLFFHREQWLGHFHMRKVVLNQNQNKHKNKNPYKHTPSHHTPHAPLNAKNKRPVTASNKTTTQPALFYPTTDHKCTTDELPLTQACEVAVGEVKVDAVVDDGVVVDEVDMVATATSPQPIPSCESPPVACIIKPVAVSVPTVSIVMTTYNCAKYIEFAIRSIQLQTLTNWELIIVNDRSTDNTDSLLRTMAQHDDRIVYLHNQHNLGCYASKNIGVQYARGHWLTFQDADDYSMSERLEKQLSFCLYGNEADAREQLYPATNTVHDCCYVTSLSRREKVWSWVPITMFVNVGVFRERLGAFDTVRFGADSEMRERMDVLGVRVGVFDDYLYACPDRWVELSSRQQSLTGNTANNPIRTKYKQAYTAFHNRLRRATVAQKRQCLKYSHTNLRTRPFGVDGLDDDERARFYPSEHDVHASMAVNAQSMD